ncbi:Calx-beta domain-containing protein [Chitinophaga agrisoli]|nr:Calx-beta domain-containing protein [Chitinophaga agrisoli]
MSVKRYRTLCCTLVACLLAAGQVLAVAGKPVKLMMKKGRFAQSISTGNPLNVREQDSYGGMDILLSGGPATEDISVTYTIGGTATQGADFYNGIWTGMATIPAGESFVHLSLDVIDDNLLEGDENVVVTVTGATGLTSAAAYDLDSHISETLWIIDNDNVITAYSTNDQAGEPDRPITARFSLPSSITAPQDITIHYIIDGGTAQNGVDYETPSGQIILPQGQNSVILSIPVIDDKLIEGNQTVKITVTGATAPGFNMTISESNSVSSSIQDDDTELSLSVTGTTDGAEPSKKGAFTVSLPPGVKAGEFIQVFYTISGTATSGVDFTTLNGTAIITTGKTTALVPVTILNDNIIEGDETIVVTITGGFSNNLGSGYSVNPGAATTTIKIIDEDNTPANTQINAIMMADGSESSADGSFKLALPGNYSFKQDMTVTYTVSGTATPGADFSPLSGTANLVAGQNSVLVPVPVLNDALIEGDETVIITPQPVIAGGISFAGGTPCTVMIEDDDDDNLKVAITAYDPAGKEGTGSDTAAFRVSLPDDNAASTPVTVTYKIEGTALNGTDYTSLVTTVTIPADSNGVFIPVYPLNDELVEGSESVKITLLTVTSSLPFFIDNTKEVATVTIIDDDSADMGIIADATVDGAEPTTPGEFKVSLSSGKTTSVPITVNYTTSGTATSGTDYTALSGSVSIPAGSTSATVAVPVLDDDLIEGDEKVIMTISGVTASLPFTAGAKNKDTVIINDDDDNNLQVVINATTQDASEPSTNGQFRISLASGKLTLVPITVTYQVSGTATAGADYTTLTGTATIPANSTGVNIPVAVLNDTIAEAKETVIAKITNVAAAVPYIIGAPDTDTVYIGDDDVEQIIISASDADAAEPNNPGQFTIKVASGKPAGAAVTANLQIDGTATNGTDYTTIPLTVVLPAGSSSVNIPLSVIDDDLIEGDETVVIKITSVTTTATFDVGKQDNAAITIKDEDAIDLSVEVVATKADAAEPGDDPSQAGEFTVRLTSGKKPGQSISVDCALSGTATNGKDYETLPANVVIPAGSSSVTIPVKIIDDLLPEGPEFIDLGITKVTGSLPFTIGNSNDRIGIADDDTVKTMAWMSARPTNNPVNPGDLIEYVIHIINGTDTNLVDIVVRDSVPAHTTFLTGEGVRPDAAGLMTWVIPTVTPGQHFTTRFSVTVANDLTGVDSIVNTGYVNFGDALGDQPLRPADPLNPNFALIGADPNMPSTSVLVNTKGAMATWKTVATTDGKEVKNGSELEYKIYVRNAGARKLGGVAILDTIPANTIYESNASNGTYNSFTNTISWMLSDSIAVGAVDSVSFLVKTIDDLTGVAEISNIATVSTVDTTLRTGNCDPKAIGCVVKEAPVVIPVTIGPAPGAPLVVPNVFTPNGDGLNEYFKIAGIETYTAPELYVFNRWGNQVYASKDYHNDWNGGSLNEGTYYYVVKVKGPDGEEKIIKGWVQILR